MYTIFVTEKPSVAQEYRKVLKVSSDTKTDGYIEGHSSVLNKDVLITWAVGHLIQLGTPEEQKEGKKLNSKNYKCKWSKDTLPILPASFPKDWIYVENGNTLSQYKVVKSVYTRKDIERIYYAGDSGREGIYIQALIRNQIWKGLNPPYDEKVVWIDSFTDEAILNGIKDAKDYSEYKNMIDSGYARAWTDWLIGMNLTQAFTLTSGGLISVGRVMTPTLSILSERQDEIENFVPHNFYGIKADNGASWKVNEKSNYFDSKKLYSDTAFENKEDADNLISELSKTLEVVDVKTTHKKEYAPLLFNLADLQATCSKLFNMSPTQTLSIAQSLYEKKLTTYPRTDARYLSSAVAKELRAKGKNIPPKYVKDEAITDHYAIIPTGQHMALEGREKSVYSLINTRFENISKPPYEYDEITTTFFDGNEMFTLVQKQVTNMGWKQKDNQVSLFDEDKVDITKYTVGQKVNADYSLYEGETKPKPMFTTGSIITEMEKCGRNLDDKEAQEILKGSGIGTSATRANIIDKLCQKGFIVVGNGQKISVSATGKAIVKLVGKYDEQLVSPMKTADMEQKLADMVEGKIPQDEYMQEVVNYISETVSNVLKNNTDKIISAGRKSSNSSATDTMEVACPCCGRKMDYGRYGYYHKDKSNCGFSISNEICSAKITKTDVTNICTNGSTAPKKMKSKAGKPFTAKLVLNKDKQALEFQFVDSPKKKYSGSKTRAKEVYYH